MQVLIIGAGIAGIKAALELAESGIKVYLSDQKPNIGGTLAQLDRWFPDNHCGMCKVLPAFNRDESSQYCLRQGVVHPNIELLLLSEVKKVTGEAGKYFITLNMKSSGVKQELCTGCGLCEHACPIEVDNEFNQGLAKCKAIHLGQPAALPKTYVIDREHCTKCGACVNVCPTNAIDLSDKDLSREIEAGAIIVSTGFEEFDPLPSTQYGYKRYPNVITSIELERLLSETGPSQGRLIRPSDGEAPESVSFLQCVGSRDLKRNYCSSACCMAALKEATMIKEAYPKTDVTIFFMDVRAFGKDYYRYYEQTRDKLGIKFTRCRVPVVKQDFQNRDLIITAVDENGAAIAKKFNLVVLSVGQTPSPRLRELSEVLGIETNKWGFCKTGGFSPVQTNREGVYVCGSASGPKDITDTLIEASAAAGLASVKATPRNNPPSQAPPEGDQEPKVAVLICSCEGQINQVLNIKELTEFTKGSAGVVYIEEVAHLCLQEAWRQAEAKIKQSGANRVILAGCSALRPYAVSKDTPVELVNIREELAWVHQNNGAATEKGKRLIAMAIERLKWRENSPGSVTPVTPKAVVIGGGLAGLVAASSISERGFEVDLVERSDRLGGNARHIHSLLEGGDLQEHLANLIEKVKADSRIHLWLETELVQFTGYAGNFKYSLRNKSEIHELEAGAIIAATGAEEFHTKEYLYGQAGPVITQRELEERLASGHIDARNLKSVVMIQCVGSREEARPYCSRICCSQALKNALKLKQQNPQIEVIVFYRDLMSYGFKEEYYTKAREEGILFVQYSLAQKPQVAFDGKELKVEALEPRLGRGIVVKPDLLVLSPPIVPYQSNADLAQMLGVEMTEDGFFKETEPKFRALDFTKEGIFVCGLAHSPRDIAETIVQAQAAAQRAALLLGRSTLVSGRVVSQVKERWCTGCELSVKICPYSARVKDPTRGVVVVREALCQGCGACVVACPNEAASLRELSDKQILSMIDAAL